MLTCLLSNSVETLFEGLLGDYFSENRPFKKSLIILPHRSLEHYLTRKFAEASREKLFFGASFITLKECQDSSFQEALEADRLYCFGASTIEKEAFEWLQMSPIPVKGYFLSPCMMYWEDLVSDKRAGAIIEQVDAISPHLSSRMEELLFDRHPLLANLGFEGRHFFTLLQESGIEIEERYVEPEPNSLLHCVQRDMLRLEKNLEKALPDTSIQIHSTPSILSEVEVLFRALQKFASNRVLDVGSMVVAVSDIERYRPYIDRVFGSLDSPFSYQILAPSIDRNSATFLAGFLQFIALPCTKFSKESLIHTLSMESFCRKHLLEYEDIASIIRDLILQNFSPLTRDELAILYRQEGIEAALPEKPQAVELFVESFISSPLEVSSAQNRAIFIQAIQNIVRDFKPIFENKNASITVWAVLLQKLLQNYFETSFKEKRDLELISTALEKLLKEDLEQKSELTYLQFCKLFEERVELLLQKREYVPRGELIFISEHSLPYPADCVALLGARETGKYRLIEALLSAQEELFISYQGFSFEECTPLSPAPAIALLEKELQAHAPRIEHPLMRTPRAQKSLFNSFEIQTSPKGPFSEKIIDLTELQMVAKNPLKVYFRDAFSIMFPAALEEGFSGLDLYLLKKELLVQEKEFFLQEAAKSNKLPQNRLKEAYMASFEEIYEEQNRALVGRASPRTIECSIGDKSALTIGPYLLTGRLEGISDSALVTFSTLQAAEVYKRWPDLLFLALQGHQEVELFSLKDKKSKKITITAPEKKMQAFIKYAIEAKKRPSLLYPECIADILAGKEFNTSIDDPYFELFCERESEESRHRYFQDSVALAAMLYQGGPDATL